MSRCYPFPPPGYGKKANNDDLGLLTKKEKHKHKKEKKDKGKEKRKDKDKKEGTEKREKDRDRKEEQMENRQKDEHKKEEEAEKREKNKGKKDKDRKDRKDKGKHKDIDRSREKDINKVKNKDKDRKKDGLQDNESPKEKHVDKGLHYQDGNRVNQWEKDKERDNQWYKIMGKDKQRDKDGENDMNKVKNRDMDRENGLKERERVREKYVENGRFKDKDGDGINQWDKGKDRDKQWDKIMDKQIGKEWDNILVTNKQRDEQWDWIVDKEKRRDNGKEREWKDDRDMGNGSEHKGQKKRKEIDTNGNLHGIGLWIHLPVLTDKDKSSNKLPRIALDKEVHTRKGSGVQEAKDVAALCIPDGRREVEGNADIEMRVASTDCHPSSCRKDAERNGMIDLQPSLLFKRPLGSHTDVPDVAPLRSGTDAHVLDLRHTHSSSPKQCWSEVDDQDWLFHGNRLHRRPKATVEVDQGSSTVWAQALYVQSTDIYALPYVLPY